MTTIEKLKKLLDERNITISRLEKNLGYGNASLAGLKKDIPFSRVVDIARYFNVPLEYFTDDENIDIDNDEICLINIFRNFNDEGKQELLKQARLLDKSGDYIKNYKYAMVQGE